MKDFIEIGSGIQSELKMPEFLPINCPIHGENVEAYLNKRCVLCARDARQAQEKSAMLVKKAIAGIKDRYLQANIQNYIVNNPKQQEIVDIVTNYDFEKDLLFLGNTGTGKTHMAAALIEMAIYNGLSSNYIKFYKLTDLKINFPRDYGKTVNAEFLVIDEYGRSESDFKSDLLFEIIDARYDNLLPTVIISNLTTTEFKKKISDAIYSRLKENCVAKEYTWQDYRLKKD